MVGGGWEREGEGEGEGEREREVGEEEGEGEGEGEREEGERGVMRLHFFVFRGLIWSFGLGRV